MALLLVNGEAIAAQVLMYCGTTAYTWKTAFSATYAKYSPGTLLIDKITEELFIGSEIRAINSCAAEASFMAQLWAGRRTIVDLLVDLGPGKSLAYRLEAAGLRLPVLAELALPAPPPGFGPGTEETEPGSPCQYGPDGHIIPG